MIFHLSRGSREVSNNGLWGLIFILFSPILGLYLKRKKKLEIKSEGVRFLFFEKIVLRIIPF